MARATGNHKRTVTVIGRGSSAAEPDQVDLRIGVRAVAVTVGEAAETANAIMANVLSALRAQDIDDRHVQTVDYRVDVVPDLSDEATRYHVTNIVQVRIADPVRLGPTLDAVVTAGANEIYGVHLTLANPGTIAAQARVAALDDAQARAAQYASQVGASLGEVLAISEVVEGMPRGAHGETGSVDRAATPVRTGEVNLTAQVQVVFALI